MEIVDAVWEKRNLGVDTVEFEIKKDDSPEQIRSIIASSEKQYNVVKSPVGNIALNTMLAEMGYVYVETMFKIVHTKKLPAATGAMKRILDHIHCKPMDKTDYEILFKEIEQGMFKTDRIAIDPRFSEEIANRRYINWIKDEISRGSEVVKVLYDNEVISFSANKILGESTRYVYLGGMYQKYINSGLGIPGTIKVMEYLLQSNPSRIITYISANNRNSLINNLASGYVIKDVTQVMIKHNN